ncbi:MAG: lyase family protein, partial [Flavobacteriales bacterium]
MEYRIEKDTMGEVKVPASACWGAQTERSRNNFKIGPEASMPKEIIHAFAILKKAAAHANHELGVLALEKRDAISTVCDEILNGQLADQFPLVIWQTGSGTQSNMNLNEVIANRAHLLSGGTLGEGSPLLNANDDVNKSQSSNDTYPTAMHIAAYTAVIQKTIPGVEQ